MHNNRTVQPTAVHVLITPAAGFYPRGAWAHGIKAPSADVVFLDWHRRFILGLDSKPDGGPLIVYTCITRGRRCRLPRSILPEAEQEGYCQVGPNCRPLLLVRT